MAFFTSTAAGILTPEQVGSTRRPARPTSSPSPLQVPTTVQTSANSFRIPLVLADGTAAWTPEGSEITPSDAPIAEIGLRAKETGGACDYQPRASH